MNLPRILFAQLPTPIEPLSRLSAELKGPTIFCKRDDLTGLGFGGNKLRKLEFLLAEAQANGARTLVTVGAIQSNHCRQTAAMAARFGIKCILVLSGEEPEKTNGNLFLDSLFGAEIVWTTRERRDQTLKEVFDKAWAGGLRPYLIPLGASNPVGTLGYFEAMKEFLDQNLDVNWIVVPSSSGGTQAGLVLGAKQFKWNGKILGISIDHPADELQTQVSSLANEASDRIGQLQRIPPEEVLVNDHFLGDGYGILGQDEVKVIRMFAQSEGLLLDPVYTARAAAGMVKLIQNGFFTRQDRILFWHTGGTPALFAEPYVSQLQD
jgi:D-cysteine desulfhydrase family pyridoxal phosphate-dependent enzyme